MFEGLCRRVVRSVADGQVDTELETLCSERTENNPNFGPLVLEMILSMLSLDRGGTSSKSLIHLVVVDNNSSSSGASVNSENATIRATVLFTYVVAIVKGAEQEFENPDHSKLLLQWFNIIWRYRSSSNLLLRSLVTKLLFTCLRNSPNMFLPTLIADYVSSPVLQGSFAAASVVPEVLVQFASLHPRLVYDHLDSSYVSPPPPPQVIPPVTLTQDTTKEEVLSVKTTSEGDTTGVANTVITSSSLEEQKVATLMLLGLLIQQKVLQRNAATEFCTSKLWLSVLTLLKCTQDGTVLTYGLWFLSLLFPHMLQCTTDYLVDLLYIFKRSVLLSLTSLKNSSSTLEETLCRKREIISSLKGLCYKKEAAVGKVFMRPSSENSMFSDIGETLPVRIRKIELWYGSGARTGEELILGLRLSIVSGVDGRIQTLPLRGDNARGTRQVLVFDPKEFLTKVDVSCTSLSRSSPAAGTKGSQQAVPSQGVGGIAALRFSTNVTSYPWIGKPSRQANLDVNCTKNTSSEIIGLHGVFEEGLRSIGVYLSSQEQRFEEVVSQPTSGFMLRYSDYLIKCLYAQFPWHVLRFLHDECAAAEAAATTTSATTTTNSFQSTVQSILSTLKLHPDIVETSENELDGTKWHDTLADEFLSVVDSLEIVNNRRPPQDLILLEENSSNTMVRTEIEFERNLKNEYRRSVRHLRALATDLEVARAEPLWLSAELKKQREICKTLQTVVDRQRHQMQTFEKEQKKWQLELQLKISKFAHERKQLSEQNIYLQESIAERDATNDRLVKELHTKSTTCLELEGALEAEAKNAGRATDLATQNETLVSEVAAWEKQYQSRVEALMTNRMGEYDNIIDKLSSELRQLRDNAVVTTKFSDKKELAEVRYRVSELELSIKQKDQANYALKEMLERHQFISEEKLNAVSDKYEHVKAANLALQKRAVQLMEELEIVQNRP